MSKSLKRVKAELDALGLSAEIVHKPDGTLTAQDAADALGASAVVQVMICFWVCWVTTN